ncbi:MAG: hypothetical protein KKI08_01705, partial [Armatimonadetes bacterium]|nr:hypothetical protein [Armatimonadota bacterium]
LWKRADGWDLAFESQNLAPFADQTSIRSVKWRLGLSGPNWQEPALRYRKWAAAHWKLTPLATQQPSWVKDTRALVICGMELDLLDRLAARMDPRQTIVYVPTWRRDGYDRNYPDYTALPELGPFMEKAHALGFRVMLHVNYFGCDPKNEAYAQFKPYQVREPFSHQPLWWAWPPAHRRKGEEPDIKFAYINPACQAWRELFVARMKEVCVQYAVDALHLDQTLCIWNDDAGLVDGMTMLEGSLAEHRELRRALPNVALSGEGLNEITCRYEAFAQRHAWGLHHSEGTWDRAALATAHPIASMILRPYTIINGYLGMTNPGNTQLYAAWQQAYVNWGVIPTFARPSAQQLQQPTGFVRQLLDEIAFFQKERVDPDLDGAAWPADTLFPYRTAAGKPVRLVRDSGWKLVGDASQTVSRTITGVREVVSPGSIAGWFAYDGKRLFGLTPEAWYPWLPAPRDLSAFHVAAMPAGLEIGRVSCGDDLATVVTRDPQGTQQISDLLVGARCGYTGFEGESDEVAGPLNESKAGASFMGNGHDLWLHPPWKATRKNPQTGVLEAAGTGLVTCTLQLKLPPDSSPRFTSEVYMDPGAVGPGKTDGLVFSIEAQAGDLKRRAEAHPTTSDPLPLELDLREFAGKEVTLRLTGDPGPKRAATFDWGRWRDPRVVMDRHVPGTATLVSPQSWTTILTSGGKAEQRQTAPHTLEIATTFPGTICLLNRPLQEIALPCDLTGLKFLKTFVAPDGTILTNPQYAAAAISDETVGGVKKHGFFAHPPSQGQTRMDFPVRLPAGVRRFSASVGLRDGSKSDGCLFILEVTGRELARKLMLPGRWEELTADLSAYAGQAVLLSLVTDADKSFTFDWGAWGEPRVE